MKKILFVILIFSGSLKAQPYLDLGQVSFHNSPGGEPKQFQHFRAQANLPIIFKDSSVFLFNPIWEERWLKVEETSSRQHYRGLIGWFTYTRKLGKKWEGMVAFIPRFNGDPEVQFKEGFQAGGAALFTYKKRPGLSFKFGGYYNTEFFGPFFWPLLGLDWKINKNQRLFAVLPAYATYENRLSKKISWGGNFRTFTNSYKVYNKPGQPVNLYYTRFFDNQVGAYMDFYILPRVVLNGEAGYSIRRKVEIAESKEAEPSILSKHDGMYFRLSLQYRIRFD